MSVWNTFTLFSVAYIAIGVIVGRYAAWEEDKETGEWNAYPGFGVLAGILWPVAAIIAIGWYAAHLAWIPLKHFMIPAKVRKARAIKDSER